MDPIWQKYGSQFVAAYRMWTPLCEWMTGWPEVRELQAHTVPEHGVLLRTTVSHHDEWSYDGTTTGKLIIGIYRNLSEAIISDNFIGSDKFIGWLLSV